MASLDMPAGARIGEVSGTDSGEYSVSAAATPESVVPFKDATLPAALLRQAPRRVGAGRDLVCEGSVAPDCIIVQEGWIAPYKLLRDGRRQLLDLLMEGDGIRVCRDAQGRAFHSIAALTDACVLEGAARELARTSALAHSGDPCTAPILAEQQRRMMERMAILGHGRAAERLAACLLDLWQRQRLRGNTEGQSCPMPIRQSDLGDAVGLTSVHVCRTLMTFRRLGLLDFAGGRLTIFSPEKLTFMAGLDPERLRRNSNRGDQVFG